MASLRPDELVLRCYGHQMGSKKWYGVCLELNLAAEAETSKELVDKLHEMILSYIDTVLDTEDQGSIGVLLSRKAPLKDWLTYYRIRLLNSIENLPNNIIFKRVIPFHLAHNC